jgi:very-short-patch-repair endonuclease
MLDQEGTYVYRPSAEEIRVVNERQPKETYESIPDSVKRMILKGDPIKLNPLSIHHFKHGSNPWEDYGTSLIRPLFPILTYKDKLRQAQFMIADRLILPIKVVKIGSDTRPASQEDIDGVQDELAALASDPNLTLVTHHNFDLEWYGASGKIHAITPEFEEINSELLDGLMLSKALLNGEGPTYGNAQVGLMAMAQRLETFRREVAHWIELKVFRPVAEWNGFVVEGERGQEEVIYPTIKFNDLQLKDDSQKLQIMATANQQGVISNTSLIEAFGLDVDQEIERLRFEQGASFMKEGNFGVPSFSMNLQSGAVTGQGFAGQAAPPGAAPPGGGMPAMPGMEAGGMMPPLASSKEENYRLAFSAIKQLYDDALETKSELYGKRYASKRIKSAAHEGFIQSIMPVTGRGIHGPLPEKYDGFNKTLIPELLGGSICSPLNIEAKFEYRIAAISNDENIKTAFKQKQEMNQPSLYTSIERKLYGLLLSLNMPYSLFAQYSAGPTGDYTLDAAIPQLGIGIEADGEIWHNNFDKIAKDKKRDSELANNGWVILRFTDKELNDHPNDVLNVIMQGIRKRTGQSSNPEEQTL